MYGKWVEALYSYDVEVWENHVAKSSSCRGSESPCRLAASLVAKAKVRDKTRENWLKIALIYFGLKSWFTKMSALTVNYVTNKPVNITIILSQNNDRRLKLLSW